MMAVLLDFEHLVAAMRLQYAQARAEINAEDLILYFLHLKSCHYLILWVL